MPATLTLDLNDRTQKAWDEFIDTLGVAKDSTDGLDIAAKRLAEDMKEADARAHALEQNVNDLAIAAKKGSDEFGNMSRSVRASEDAIKGVANSGKSAGGAGGGGGLFGVTNLNSALEIVGKLTQGFQWARDQAKALGESGNKAFSELEQSIVSVEKSWESARAKFGAGDFGQGLAASAKSFSEEMGKGLDALPDLFENFGVISREFFATSVEGWGEYGKSVRSATDYQNELTFAAQRTRDAVIETQRAEAEAAKGREAAASVTKGLAELRRKEADQAAAAGIHNEQGINLEIQKQVDLLNSGKVKQEEIKAILEKIGALEQRRAGVRQEAEQAIRDEAAGWNRYYEERKRSEENLAKEQAKIEEDARKKRQAEYENEIKQRIDIYRYQLKQQQDAEEKAAKEREARVNALAQSYRSGPQAGDTQRQSVDIERRAQEQIAKIRQQQIQQYVTGDVKGFFESERQKYDILNQSLQAQKQLRDKFLKEASPVEQIKAQITDKDLAAQIEKDRLDKLRADRAKNRPDPFANDDVVDPKEERQRARYDRETRRQEQNARRQLRRDMQRGNVGEDEVNQATNNLVKATVDRAQQEGKVGAQQAEAMNKVVEIEKQRLEQDQQREAEAKALTESLEEVRGQLEELGVSQRSRAMRR